jgi:hypothetical protein
MNPEETESLEKAVGDVVDGECCIVPVLESRSVLAAKRADENKANTGHDSSRCIRGEPLCEFKRRAKLLRNEKTEPQSGLKMWKSRRRGMRAVIIGDVSDDRSPVESGRILPLTMILLNVLRY